MPSPVINDESSIERWQQRTTARRDEESVYDFTPNSRSFITSPTPSPSSAFASSPPSSSVKSLIPSTCSTSLAARLPRSVLQSQHLEGSRASHWRAQARIASLTIRAARRSGCGLHPRRFLLRSFSCVFFRRIRCLTGAGINLGWRGAKSETSGAIRINSRKSRDSQRLDTRPGSGVSSGQLTTTRLPHPPPATALLVLHLDDAAPRASAVCRAARASASGAQAAAVPRHPAEPIDPAERVSIELLIHRRTHPQHVHRLPRRASVVRQLSSGLA